MSERIIPADRSVIVAADVEPEKFEGLVRDVGKVEGLSGYKIGFEVGYGLTIAKAVATVKEANPDSVAIFDHQKAGNDIPDTGMNFGRTMKRGGVDAAILFPFTGPATQERWTKELQDQGIGVLTGSEMTHPKIRRSEGGYIADDAFAEMFELAVALGVRDFVVPGNKPDKVADYRGFFEERLGSENFTLYAPGFVAQGGEISEAGIAAGYNWHAIVGRGIIAASNVHIAAVEHTQQILAA